MDELRSRLTYERELRDCCVLCFTGIWIPPVIPNCDLQADGFSIHLMDCMVSSGKAKGGGVCFLINISWCLYIATLASHCSSDLEYLTIRCYPCYLPQEFTSTILTAVYIPPHVDVKKALDEIYTTTNALETKFPEALFIVTGNFNLMQ
eukprot:g25897.t1